MKYNPAINVFLILIIGLSACVNSPKLITEEYTKPEFGENVLFFTPNMDNSKIQHTIDSIYNLQSQRSSEFNKNRFALLFAPGEYNLDIKVGYYTHIIGLGKSPEDVIITGAVRSNSMTEFHGNVLINFWRAAENLTVIPTIDSTNVWGVSQAAPLRRIHIKGNLQLHDKGPASGGFLADSKIDGEIDFGPQQQWFTRNSEWGSYIKGIWNIMTLGVPNPPKENWPETPYLSLDKTPRIREKPYLISSKKNISLVIPELKTNSSGPSWIDDDNKNLKTLPIKDFYITKPENDNSTTINAALETGKNILFTPGIYELENSIEVSKPGTIIMGIGMPSLVPKQGNPVIKIADVDGVTLSGILVDAGEIKTETLIEIGEPGSDADHSSNPTFIYDVFIRVGGPHIGTTKCCLEINSNDVYIDHVWLWRADHGNGVGWDLNKAANGLIVNGDNVTAYGLFNEHMQEYQTLWNGDNGKVYFYQSEMPYYAPSPEAWKHGETYGYASYKVPNNVSSHEAWGVGIYNVFFNAPIIVDNAIETPEHLEKNIHHKFTIWLGGNEDSEVKSVINGKGDAVNKSNKKSYPE